MKNNGKQHKQPQKTTDHINTTTNRPQKTKKEKKTMKKQGDIYHTRIKQNHIVNDNECKNQN